MTRWWCWCVRRFGAKLFNLTPFATYSSDLDFIIELQVKCRVLFLLLLLLSTYQLLGNFLLPPWAHLHLHYYEPGILFLTKKMQIITGNWILCALPRLIWAILSGQITDHWMVVHTLSMNHLVETDIWAKRTNTVPIKFGLGYQQNPITGRKFLRKKF